MIDRSAVILVPKQPMLDWIHSVDENEELKDLTLSDLKENRIVYLVTPDDAADLEGWITMNFTTLFQIECEEWTEDEELWPQAMDLETFRIFFSAELHDIVLDTVGESIPADEEFTTDIQ